MNDEVFQKFCIEKFKNLKKDWAGFAADPLNEHS